MAASYSQIPAPRVPFLDPQTNMVSPQWFLWFNNVYGITGNGVGIVQVGNGGTGLGTIPANGQLLIGNGDGYTLKTLTQSTGITISNGVGAISIANSGVLSWSGGATGLTPSTATTGAVTLGGKLAIEYGGTNGTVTPTAGAIAYGNGTAYAFTSAGTAGQVLTSAGSGTPTWSTISGTGTVTSVAATVPSFLSITGSPITTSGTLAISYSGTALPIANGGTGETTLAGASIATYAGTETLTNKWIKPRVLASTANSATPTLNTDSYDMMVITGQTVAITSFTTNLTGTPVNGQKLWISITSTANITAWGASFESSGTVTLPTTLTSGVRTDIGFVWNVAASKWRCIAVA